MSSDEAFSHINAGLEVWWISINRYAKGEGEWLIDVGGVGGMGCVQDRLMADRATIATRWLYLDDRVYHRPRKRGESDASYIMNEIHPTLPLCER